MLDVSMGTGLVQLQPADYCTVLRGTRSTVELSTPVLLPKYHVLYWSTGVLLNEEHFHPGPTGTPVALPMILQYGVLEYSILQVLLCIWITVPPSSSKIVVMDNIMAYTCTGVLVQCTFYSEYTAF
jgi:hypothetical protein